MMINKVTRRHSDVPALGMFEGNSGSKGKYSRLKTIGDATGTIPIGGVKGFLRIGDDEIKAVKERVGRARARRR